MRKNFYPLFFLIFLCSFSVLGSLLLSFERKIIKRPRINLISSDIAKVSKNKYPILLINLFIDRINNKVEIKSIKRGLGFAPDYKNPNILDFLNVEIEEKNKTKKRYLIPLPIEVNYDKVDRDGKLTGGFRKLDQFNYSVTLPFKEESTVLIKKDFIKDQKIITSVNNLRIPKFSLSKPKRNVNILVEDRPGTLPLEDLILPSTTNYLVETIFDGSPLITDPSKTIDIVFLSSGYPESGFEVFRQFSLHQADALIGFDSFPGKAPFPENKNLFKVRRVISSNTFHEIGGSWPDYLKIYETLLTLGVPFDQFVLVPNEPSYYAAFFDSDTIILSHPANQDPSEISSLLFAHEFGHAFGALFDEYTAGASIMPAVKESEKVKLKEFSTGVASDEPLDFLRNCKNDPDEVWVDGTSDSFLGCNLVWNFYRPALRSIMGVVDDLDEFNGPSRFFLEEALKVYAQEVFIPYADMVKDLTYYNKNDINPRTNRYITVYSLGTKENINVPVRGYFSPDVPWIINRNLEGVLTSGSFGRVLSFEYDLNYLKSKETAKYETVLNINFFANPGPPLIKQIPITVLYDDNLSQTASSLRWISPKDGEKIDISSITPIILEEQTVGSFGWKRIEFYHQGKTDKGSLFYIKTLAPYRGYLDPKAFLIDKFQLGEDYLWAKGIPFSGKPLETDHIKIKIIGMPNDFCINNYRNNFKCEVGLKTPGYCLQDKVDCFQEAKPYCCAPPACPPVCQGNDFYYCGAGAIETGTATCFWGGVSITPVPSNCTCGGSPYCQITNSSRCPLR